MASIRKAFSWGRKKPDVGEISSRLRILSKQIARQRNKLEKEERDTKARAVRARKNGQMDAYKTYATEMLRFRKYALAVDRVNEKIAYLYNPAHPAVLRLIKTIIDNAHKEKIWVGMCGEMAGDVALTIILIGLGLDEFSTSPIIVPEVKRIIRSVKYQEAQKIAKEALTLTTGSEVYALAKAKLKKLVPDISPEFFK